MLPLQGQSGPGSNDNKVVLSIRQSSSISRSSPIDCLVSYPGHLLERVVLLLCRGAVGELYSPSRLGKILLMYELFSIEISCILFFTETNKIWYKPKYFGSFILIAWYSIANIFFDITTSKSLPELQYKLSTHFIKGHVLCGEHLGTCSRFRSGAWLCKRNLCMALGLAV